MLADRRICNFPAVLLLTALAAAGLAVGVCGCTRTKYRQLADREAYRLVASRQMDPRWDLPARPVEPERISRMYVGAEQDLGPKPTDDPAAKRYMDRPDGKENTHYYFKIGTRTNTQNPIWIDYLQRNEDDQIELTQPLAMDLALIHSRDYQTRFESVYRNALELSGNRFEFALQWFGGLGTDFFATGDDLGGNRRLTVGNSDQLGFTRNLAGGGQFATDVFNSLFWDFGTGDVGGAAAVVTTFTQPILRGAFRHVRLENLTQAERNLLYSVRDFARFRRLFYQDVTESYLGLLTLVQANRNLRTNVDNLRSSLEEYELYIKLGTVSPVELDQVYQDYQRSRLDLLDAEQRLARSLDLFKFQLGLPPWVPFEIDESLLEPFELVDPNLVELQNLAEALYLDLVQFYPPDIAPKQVLVDGLKRLTELQDRIEEKLPALEEELAKWRSRLDAFSQTELSTDDRLDVDQQSRLTERIQGGLSELSQKLDARESTLRRIRDLVEQYDSDELDVPREEVEPQGVDRVGQEFEFIEQVQDLRPPVVALKALLNAVGKDLREEVSECFVAQTQIRLFLIDIEPLTIEQETAITFAHRNRLDLMNSQALVTDAFRKVEVAADALQSDLDVNGTIGIGSDPSINNAFRLDSSANTYQVGLQFDGPLNRLNERNNYRATQIDYQRAARDFVGLKDNVANEVREVLRQLKLRRLNFQIARQTLVSNSRQVDQAQIALRTGSSSGGSPSTANPTLFLLEALNNLTASKNQLISEWIAYRLQKIRLFTALDFLYLDEAGRWINEIEGLEQIKQFMAIDPEYFPPQWVQPGKPREELDYQDNSGPDVEDLPPPPAMDFALPDADQGGGHPTVRQARALSIEGIPFQNGLRNTEAGPDIGGAVPSVPYAFGFDEP